MAIYTEKPNDDGVMFSYPRYVIKGGEVVVEEGEIRAVVDGPRVHRAARFDDEIEEFIRPLFQKFYTMSFDNYPVEMDAAPATRRSCRAHRLVRRCRPVPSEPA